MLAFEYWRWNVGVRMFVFECWRLTQGEGAISPTYAPKPFPNQRVPPPLVALFSPERQQHHGNLESLRLAIDGSSSGHGFAGGDNGDRPS